MTDYNIPDVFNDIVEPIDYDEMDPDELSLEALVLLLMTERLDHLRNKSLSELTELKERQNNVAELNKILKAINKATDDQGALDVSNDDELQDLLDEARTYGVEIADEKMTFSQDERNRLVENIRMTVEDLNVQNEMQLQTVTRLTNERHEMYQMARTILKPLHDAKISHARAMRGSN